MPEVILRDFDGTETILKKDPPLPEIIHTGEAESGTDLLIGHRYLKTAETDPQGRPVYAESNL